MNVKQYLALIKNFYKSHAQINTAKSGNQFNFNADSKIVYPIAHVEFIDQATNDTSRVKKFLVTIADIYDPSNEASEEDIYSDTFEVADDTLDYFSNQIQDDYIVSEQSNTLKFNNGNTDKVAGCTFILSFTEFRTANDCGLPLNL